MVFQKMRKIIAQHNFKWSFYFVPLYCFRLFMGLFMFHCTVSDCFDFVYVHCTVFDCLWFCLYSMVLYPIICGFAMFHYTLSDCLWLSLCSMLYSKGTLQEYFLKFLFRIFISNYTAFCSFSPVQVYPVVEINVCTYYEYKSV